MATKKKAVEADEVVPTSLPVENDSSDMLAISSLVVGIISLCSSWIICCGAPFSIIAIVLGVLGRKSEDKANLATVGIVLGSLGLLLAICFAIWSAMTGGFDYSSEYYL